MKSLTQKQIITIDRTKLNIKPFIIELPLFGHECNAKRCKEMVIIGGPYCKFHTFQIYSLEIKKTTLFGCDFNGLFVCKDFLIVPYFSFMSI